MVREDESLEDGVFILWVARKKLKEIGILPEWLVYDGKKYKMLPSVSASIVMLIDYLQEKGEL